jgi:hypothetical protein
MDFEEESGTRAFLLRARREGLRDFGACMAPMTAFQILQGIETLPVRMARHVENTRAIVAFLREHPLVAAIGYPELAEHPDNALTQRLLPRGAARVQPACAARTSRTGVSSGAEDLLASRQCRRCRRSSSIRRRRRISDIGGDL